VHLCDRQREMLYMCVRVCVWGGVCVCVCMHVCICVRICICVCVYVWVVVNVCVCVRGHVSANLFWMCIILCAHDFMVCAIVCTCTSNRIRQIDRTHVCACVCTCIHVFKVVTFPKNSERTEMTTMTLFPTSQQWGLSVLSQQSNFKHSSVAALSVGGHHGLIRVLGWVCEVAASPASVKEHGGT